MMSGHHEFLGQSVEGMDVEKEEKAPLKMPRYSERATRQHHHGELKERSQGSRAPIQSVAWERSNKAQGERRSP